MSAKGIFAVAALLLLMSVGYSAASSSSARMVTRGNAEINGVAAPDVTSAFAGDRISTGKETTTSLSFAAGGAALIPELSKATFSVQDGRTVLNIEDGSVSVLSKKGAPVVVMARGARIEVAGGDSGSFSVTLHGNALRVVPAAGAAHVATANRAGDIQPGTALDATLAPAQSAPGSGGSNNFTASTTTWIIIGASAAAIGGGLAAWQLTQGNGSPVIP